jgi:hypothetical protein
LSARWVSAAAAAAAFVVATSSGAAGSPRLDSPVQVGYAATAAQERLQRQALELEAAALRARDMARLDEQHGGRDDVTDRMDDFADEARELAELMRKTEADGRKINEHIRDLMNEAAKVQREWAKATRRNPETVAAWNRTLEVLTDVNHQYLVANGLATPSEDRPVGTSGTPGESPTWEGGRGMLGRDLARQAERAERLSRASSSGGVSADLAELRRQVDRLVDPVTDLAAPEAHDRIVALLFDAQQVQRRLSLENAPADLRDQVNAMVGTLVQMRNRTGARAAGMAGYDRPAASAAPSVPSEPSQIMADLNQRTLRASELATDATLYELSGKLRDFRDKLREFDRMAPQMDRDARRDRLDSLLREAQERQRDLAEGGAPLAVVTEWNAVVDLLVRLRNAS